MSAKKSPVSCTRFNLSAYTSLSVSTVRMFPTLNAVTPGIFAALIFVTTSDSVSAASNATLKLLKYIADPTLTVGFCIVPITLPKNFP